MYLIDVVRRLYFDSWQLTGAEVGVGIGCKKAEVALIPFVDDEVGVRRECWREFDCSLSKVAIGQDPAHNLMSGYPMRKKLGPDFL